MLNSKDLWGVFIIVMAAIFLTPPAIALIYYRIPFFVGLLIVVFTALAGIILTFVRNDPP